MMAAVTCLLGAFGAVAPAARLLRTIPASTPRRTSTRARASMADSARRATAPNGDQVSGIDLRRGQFRRGMSDEELARTITNGIPGGRHAADPLQPAELTGVIAFIRAGFDPDTPSIRSATPARGKSLVEGKGACLTCHRIKVAARALAPDLSPTSAWRAPLTR